MANFELPKTSETTGYPTLAVSLRNLMILRTKGLAPLVQGRCTQSWGLSNEMTSLKTLACTLTTWLPLFKGLMTTAASQADSLQEDIIVVPMPQLSPHMTSGTISKWLKKPGDEISTYDVVFEVDTDSLSEEAYKVGDFAGSVTMLIEVSRCHHASHFCGKYCDALVRSLL